MIQAWGDISGIASTGHHAVNLQNRVERMTVLPAEALRPVTELAIPPGMVNLPVRSALFVGRIAALARLDEAFSHSDRAVVQALHGLGGIGKSTLAAHWAAVHADDYSLIWWIAADTATGIDAGLADLALALQPELSGVLPPEALRERAVQWLAAHQGWLIILDNVTDPADIAPLLGRTVGGNYLITSRRATGWHKVAASVRLDVLDPADATDLLTRILAQHMPRDLNGIDQLCAELGHLPLAIEQAGGYLAETGSTLREYLRLLARYPAEMYEATAEGGDAARTIGRIWDITLDRLADDPLAGQVLRILAWYAPDGIPRSILDGLAEAPALTRAIGRLATYSMLTVGGTDLAVHRLVQAVARTPAAGHHHRDPQAVEEARDQAIRQLAAALPDQQAPTDWMLPTDWPAWRILLPHVDSLASRIPPDADTEAMVDILCQASMSLAGQGQFGQAAEYLQRALTYQERIEGSDHPGTMSTRTNLASVYQRSGNLGPVIPLLEQTLADSERVQGSDHPETLLVRSKLGCAYNVEAGDQGRAILMLRQVLADSERLLGSDHLYTLCARSDLGDAYRDAGDLDHAIPLLQQVFADTERLLGSDHVMTLISGGNLAIAYRLAGDLDRAVSLLQHALSSSERLLGSDHPNTLIVRNNLAVAYSAAGDPGRAIALLRQVLADREQVFGGDHPDTITARNDLAIAYRAAGKPSQAIPHLKRAVADGKRVFGSDHLNTLTFLNHLATAYQEAGDLRRAIPLFEEVLDTRHQLLGSSHPHTLISRNNLALAYQEAGNADRAIPLFEQALAGSEQVGGSNHRDTLLIRTNLGNTYLTAGDLGRAIPLLRQALADSERVLGSDDLDTLNTRIPLAMAYFKAENWGRAIPLLEQILADSERVRSSGHNGTGMSSRKNLDLRGAHLLLGDLDQMIPVFKEALADSKKRRNRRYGGEDNL
jgi:tetratricopeptide (TPR) repeat protein